MNKQRHFGNLILLFLGDVGPDSLRCAEESQGLCSVSLHFLSSQFAEVMTMPSAGPSAVRENRMRKIISQQ